MDQIRSTMMQHEALFREQVKALHQLYYIQKLAMKEFKKIIPCQAQVLTSNIDNIASGDCQFRYSHLNGKALMSACATSQVYCEDPLALSLNIFSASKEIKGHETLDTRGVKTCSLEESNVVRHFDLEKLPEDNVDGHISQVSCISLNPNSNHVEFGKCHDVCRTLEQSIDCPSSPKSPRYLDGHTEVTYIHNSEKASDDVDDNSRNSEICYQGSSTAESVKGNSKSFLSNIRNFHSSGNVLVDANDNTNDLVNKGYNAQAQDANGFKDNIAGGNCESDNNCCQAGWTRHGTTSSDEPGIAITSNKFINAEAELEDVQENIAAEILLSLAPGKSCTNSGPHNLKTRPEVIPCKSGTNAVAFARKWNQFEVRCTGFCDGSGTKENISWNTVGRTTLRRP
ncbi:hypothetical protein RJ641_022123 [Dillenia turbinata]|uniref:Uncharacterized protein n=1 Tax=Dillenia turbinata TaxID=194707 RepID=A0AAN8ULU1_9MAGN